MATVFHGKFEQTIAKFFGPETARKVLKLRKQAASYVLGEQVAAFVPEGRGDVHWAHLTDEELGALYRSFAGHLFTQNEVEAKVREIPIDTMIMQTSVVAWAERMLKQNANEMTLSINNEAKKTKELTGNWQINVKKLPDDYEFGPEGMHGREEDGKLVEFTVNWKKR